MSHDPAGSPRPFDFGDDPAPAGPGRPAGNPFEDQPAEQPGRRRFSWIALIVSVGVAVLVGVGGYVRTAAYADGWDVDSGIRWIALTVLCVIAILIAIVLAVVAVVRSRPSATGGSRVPLLIAVIALAAALVLPWVGLVLGSSLAPLPPAP
ncbi:hypothetical protein [Microlunatus parietis]|uniref:Uncharacterized membrane protein YhaH (DUF805 family) n=1 Tax=Microlunatus parietis TaxID=682979 RepID=A0A7Y9I844_9ACTN|nr:hypothetical protein [Microlunatus parietis]NYE72063.1 uncharacterized membrane protein YhaH (DUF805 family) [Microlunatus parietis]